MSSMINFYTCWLKKVRLRCLEFWGMCYCTQLVWLYTPYKTFIKACLYDPIISTGHTHIELGGFEAVRIINNDPIYW